MHEAAYPAIDVADGRTIKCVVWDLDNTLWDGVILEEHVELRRELVDVIKELDSRGILHSIASRNDEATALEMLRRHGLADLFLLPQINWGQKSVSVKRIAEEINIGLDAVAFVDDQPYERDEVTFALPQVLCLDPSVAETLPSLAAFTPRFITAESGKRRSLYQADLRRKEAESVYEGPKKDFHATLGMKLNIREATRDDLQRAEELTVRTNQLNSTGRTYTYEELDALRHAPDHWLMVASLSDVYGDYGTIGLALVEQQPEEWTVRLLLMSCRVMSRGVGSVLMTHIQQRARDAGVRLAADFVQTDRNRAMYVSFVFGGFEVGTRDGAHLTFIHPLTEIQPLPPHVTVHYGSAPPAGELSAAQPGPSRSQT